MQHDESHDIATVSDELYERLVSYAQGRCSDAERRDVERLVRGNSTAAETLAMIRTAAAVLANYTTATDLSDEDTQPRIQAVCAQLRSATRRPTWAWAAAGMGLAAVFALWVWLDRTPVVGQMARSVGAPLGPVEWDRVQRGAVLRTQGKESLAVNLAQGATLTIAQHSEVRVFAGCVDVLCGGVRGSSSAAPLELRLMTAVLLVPPETTFSVTREAADSAAWQVTVSKEATLRQEGDSRTLPADQMSRLTLRGRSARD
jgi:hypothetical protein